MDPVATQDGERDLEARVEYLEQTNHWLFDSLDQIAQLASLAIADGSADARNDLLLAAGASIRHALKFEAMGFLQVNEEDGDFVFTSVEPRSAEVELQSEFERRVADGTFAWAMKQSRPLLVPDESDGPPFVFGPLATRTRVMGMFVGRLPASETLTGAAMRLLAMALTTCAHALESAILYHEIRSHNANLEAMVAARTADLEASREQAQKATRAKGEFLAHMSHEIRSPLNGVIGMTRLLVDTDLSDDQRECAEVAKTCGEALLEIVNDILDFSKIEAGRLDLEVLEFELRTLVEDVVEIIAERSQAKGVEVVAAIDPGIPRMVRTDPARIRQMLTNLVGNAAKFTTEGEIVVMVSGTTEGQIRFAVRDTGIGIAPATLPRLFEAFKQAESSTTRRFGGTGLGLAIVKQLANRMGGEVGVESEVGRGSTFWFQVPVESVANPGNPTAELMIGLHLIVVDERESSRTALLEECAARGATVAGFAEAGSALTSLLAAVPLKRTVVIVDRDIPPEGAFSLATAIRGSEALKGCGLILLSKFGQRGTATAARGAGFQAAVSKPVRLATLQAAVSDVASGAEWVLRRRREGETQINLRPRAPEDRPLILVADDSSVNQKVASRLLEKLGYRCHLAANGAEAIEALTRANYSAVLMDLQMPEMDGIEACQEWRRREAGGTARTPIIALTADAQDEDRRRCFEGGMDDFLTKPVNPNALAAMLQKWVAAATVSVG